MSVRVNLLPRELAAVSRARAVTRLSVLGVALVAVLLGSLTLLQLQQVAEAERERDAAQARVTQAEQRLAALAEYRELKDRYEARKQLLAAAMADEISWARILNDLSLAFPSDSSLTTLTASADASTPAAGEIDPGSRVGRIVANGYSLDRYAPGVESVLIDFDGARGFFNSYLQTAAATRIGDNQVTNFSGTIDLDDDAYTRRYAEGLPPEVTP
jgi:hypothetical protein